jgi:predicted PurR-regulated permease PerM
MSIWVVLSLVLGWYLAGYLIDRLRRRLFPASSDVAALLVWFGVLIAPIGIVALVT